jgi:hypothetical protein
VPAAAGSVSEYVMTDELVDETTNGPGKTSVLPVTAGSAIVEPLSFAEPATYVAPLGIVSTTSSTRDDAVDVDCNDIVYATVPPLAGRLATFADCESVSGFVAGGIAGMLPANVDGSVCLTCVPDEIC